MPTTKPKSTKPTSSKLKGKFSLLTTGNKKDGTELQLEGNDEVSPLAAHFSGAGSKPPAGKEDSDSMANWSNSDPECRLH